MAKTKPAKMLAILGRSRRTGRWRMTSRSSVLAILGAVHLDMRDAFVDDDKLKMTVTVFLGSATFILPQGAEVRPSGVSLLGSSSVEVPEHTEDAHLPMLEIEWISMLGRMRVVTEQITGDQQTAAAAEMEPDPRLAPVTVAPAET